MLGIAVVALPDVDELTEGEFTVGGWNNCQNSVVNWSFVQMACRPPVMVMNDTCFDSLHFISKHVFDKRMFIE